jgi:GNAT superfamily N-acetyltransferase
MDDEGIVLHPLRAIGAEITPLVLEAEGQGHRFMRRLSEDWASGVNRFAGPGELLLGGWAGERLVAVGGLNKDPYVSADTVGRLRHVYVLGDVRRLGIGTLIVERIIAEASARFSLLRLRTMAAEGAAFYDRLGFQRAGDPFATHVIDLRSGRPAA